MGRLFCIQCSEDLIEWCYDTERRWIDIQKKRIVIGVAAILVVMLLCLSLLSESTGVQMFRLFRAWNQWNRQEVVCADLDLQAECGVLQISQTVDYYLDRTEEPAISALGKHDFMVYFTDRAMCDENGKILSETAEGQSSASLLGIAYELCRNSSAEIQKDSYVFTIHEAGMQEIAAAIAPETQELDITYESGTVRIELEDGALKQIDFSVSGSMPILFVQTDATISATFRFKEGNFEIPEAVRNTLSES